MFGRRRRSLLIGVGAGAVIIVVALLVLASVVSRIFGNVGRPQQGRARTQRADIVGSRRRPAAWSSPPRRRSSPRRRGRQSGHRRERHRRRPVHRLADRHLPRHRAVPRLQERCRADVATAQPHGGRHGDHGHDQHGDQGRDSRPHPPRRRRSWTTPPCWLRPLTLKPGHNVIPVRAGATTSNLLVWISTLGTIDGKNRADFSEITVQAAS